MIDIFITHYTTPCISLWEAAKAIFTGKYIELSAYIRKEETMKSISNFLIKVENSKIGLKQVEKNIVTKIREEIMKL
jgi:hypothetical protein